MKFWYKSSNVIGEDEEAAKDAKPSSSSCVHTDFSSPHKNHHKNDKSFAINDFDFSRCSSLSNALEYILKVVSTSSWIGYEIVLTQKMEEITYECFQLIQQIFCASNVHFFFLNTTEDESHNFILWNDHKTTRQNIFTLQLQKEEKKLFSYIKGFLITSFRSSHNGLHLSLKYEKTHTKVVINTFSLGDSKGFDLLAIAAESGDIETLKILLKLGFDVHDSVNGVTAIDLAYKSKNFEIVLELLKHHSRFPENFQPDGASGELTSFIEMSKSLHENIESRNKEAILEILPMNPNLKYFYNLENCSALAHALLNEDFEIYEIFLQNNFAFGPNENIVTIINSVDENLKETLNEIHERNSKPLLAPHLMILLSNSSMGFDNENDPEKISAVTLAYQTLDKNPVVSQILKIVAAKNDFKIIFDFERDSVKVLDPSTEGYANGMFYSNGKILVAAQDLMFESSKNRTYGVIAHELCHFAIHLTFDNYAKPYYKNDRQSEREFDAVIAYCQHKKDFEPIVASAIDDYPPEAIPAEVVVRYPHMLGHYHDQHQLLEQCTETFSLLKEFHEAKVVPAMNEEIIKLQKRADMKGKYLKAKKKISMMTCIIFGLAALLMLSSPLIYFSAQSFSKVWHELNVKEQNFIKNNIVQYHGVDIKLGELFHENSSTYNDISSHHLKLALNNDSSGLNNALKSFLHHKVKLIWKNCTENLRKKILKTAVNFQGKIIELDKVLNLNSSIYFNFSAEQIKHMIEGGNIKIGSHIKKKNSFFIERKFKTESLAFNKSKQIPEVSVENTINEVFKDGIFLLVDGPGSGKSMALNNLAITFKDLYPGYWVVFLDLKDHSEVYNNNFMKIIGSEIVKLKDFELLMFEELFSEGRVAIFWDAFDEVNKEYHQVLLKNFLSINNETKNLQFISSRPEYRDILKDTLSANFSTLIPFNSTDRERFFEEELKNISLDEQKRVKNKIQNIIGTNVGINQNDGQKINNPLLLRMIAELLKENKNLNLRNRFEVYEKFVEKKVDSIEVNRLRQIMKQKLTVWDIHVIYAMRILLNDSFPLINSLEIMRNKITLSNDEITSFGLMTINDDNKLDFIHRTFGDFFIAYFIVDNIFDAIETVPEYEMDLRIRFMLEFTTNDVANFLFDYLRNSNKNDVWDEANIEVIRKIVLNYSNEFIIPLNPCRIDKLQRCETLRRFLIKDEESFKKILNVKYENVSTWLDIRFSIKLEHITLLLNQNNHNYMNVSQKEHPIGNIIYRVWYHHNLGEFSNSYLINKYTGLNLDDKTLKQALETTFQDFYKLIQKHKKSTSNIFKENFAEILLFDHRDDDRYFRIWRQFINVTSPIDIQTLLKKINKNGENIFHIITKIRDSGIVELLLQDIGKYWIEKDASMPTIWKLPMKYACENLKIKRTYLKFIRKYLNKNDKRYFSPCRDNDEWVTIVLDPYKKDDDEFKNCYDTYNAFVQKKIESVQDENKRKNIFKFFESQALKHLLYDEPKFLELDIFKHEKIIGDDDVTFFGLMVNANNKTFKFVDETIGEFFVAHFIVDNVFKLTENISEPEMKLRYEVLLRILNSFSAELLYNFLRNFHEIESINGKFLQKFNNVISMNDFAMKNESKIQAEIMRRLLIQGGEREHLKIDINQFYEISVNYEQNLTLNRSQVNLEKSKLQENKAAILFKIWYHLNRGEYSLVYLINKYSEINFDKVNLMEIGNQENPYELYNYQLIKYGQSYIDFISFDYYIDKIFCFDWNKINDHYRLLRDTLEESIVIKYFLKLNTVCCIHMSYVFDNTGKYEETTWRRKRSLKPVDELFVECEDFIENTLFLDMEGTSA